MAKSKKKDIPWDELPEVMKPEQVQEKIQISSATFFRLVQNGKLPGAKKIGDSWRISRDQLRAYFEGESEEMDEVDEMDEVEIPEEEMGSGHQYNRQLGPLTKEEINNLDTYAQTEDEEEDSDSEQSASDSK